MNREEFISEIRKLCDEYMHKIDVCDCLRSVINRIEAEDD